MPGSFPARYFSFNTLYGKLKAKEMYHMIRWPNIEIFNIDRSFLLPLPMN